jgi:O-antigen ligase
MKSAFIEKNYLVIFFSLVPIFLLTFSSWSSIILIFGSVFCVAYFIFSKTFLNANDVSFGNRKFLHACLAMLAAPIVAVLASACLRSDFQDYEFDSPSRFLLALLFFLFSIKTRADITRYLQYTIPAALIITFLHQIFFQQPKLWGVDRMSTYFADPLVFGYVSLTFGLISFASINLTSKDPIPLILTKISGFGIGIYLSIMSGSRTGWLAVPIVLGILWFDKFKTSKRKINTKNTFILISIVTVFLLSAFTLSSTSKDRLNLAFKEFIEYPWHGIAPDTSVGQRITFIRIASDLIVEYPVSGVGDTARQSFDMPENIKKYASPQSVHMALHSGFHNQIVTNAIRYGIFGGLAAIMLFIVPLLIFIHQYKKGTSMNRYNSLIGMVFTACFFVSSLSTEVFDLKYMASFYAVMISLLCASAISPTIASNFELSDGLVSTNT